MNRNNFDQKAKNYNPDANIKVRKKWPSLPKSNAETKDI